MFLGAKPGDEIGAYQIKRLINTGGMAYVVLAQSRGRNYVLKITRAISSVEQFETNNVATRKEARLLSTLSHDRIVKIFPLETDLYVIRPEKQKVFYAKAVELANSPWYFVMEYLSGGTLDNYVKRCGPLTVSEATNIVGNIGLGLGYLHEKHIAHNDVKSENIVFRKRIVKGEPYDPVLIDFGIAAGVKNFVDESGSWYVMSPERVRVATGREAPEFAMQINPARADMWSLGLLLYQSLTNSSPFPSSNQRTLTSQILNDTPESTITRNMLVPKKLDDFIVDSCLSKRPEERPTIREFLEFIYEYSGRGVPATSIKDGYYGEE